MQFRVTMLKYNPNFKMNPCIKVEIIHYTMVKTYKICKKNYDFFAMLSVLKVQVHLHRMLNLFFFFIQLMYFCFYIMKRNNLGIFH